MFSRTNTAADCVETLIAKLAIDMTEYSADSPEYDTMLNKLKALYALKETDRPRKVSPDTLAIVLGNLAGIGIIVSYERVHPMMSKAVGFVLKAR